MNDIGLLLSGHGALIVGVEDDPGGGLRVFLGERWRAHYWVPPHEFEALIERDWRVCHRHLVVDLRHLPASFCAATMPGHDVGHHERDARPL